MDLSSFVQGLFGWFADAGRTFSPTSIICAVILATGFLAWRRYSHGRKVRVRVLIRALFPNKLVFNRSHIVDFAYLYFNMFLFTVTFGWAIFSYEFVSDGVIKLLVAGFGQMQPSGMPDLYARGLATLAIFLGYEFGYWLNHYYSHRIPVLWEFHKVHHSAEVLTPLTVFRVHPIDMVLFYNFVSVFAGGANGLVNYMLGESAYQYSVSNSNILIVLFLHLFLHLHHSHIWITFQGLLGRVLLSPAHHQIHHSTNPAHFNKNLGSCLAIWDWAFGTLYIPSKQPEKLTFGVEPHTDQAYTIRGGFLDPFVHAAGHVRGWIAAALPARADTPSTTATDQPVLDKA